MGEASSGRLSACSPRQAAAGCATLQRCALSGYENRHLEHQRRARPARQPHALAARERARHRLPAGDQIRRRPVPARRDRGARLQRRDARPKGLQRRRHPVEAAASTRSIAACPATTPTSRRASSKACSRPKGRAEGGLALPAQRQSRRRREEFPLQARLDGAAGALGERAPSAGRAAGARRRLQCHPRADDARFPENWVERRAVPAGDAASLPPARKSRLHRRGPRGRPTRRGSTPSGTTRPAPGRRTTASASTICCCRRKRPTAFSSASIDKHVRAWEKPSDHVPVAVELSLEAA